VKFQSSEKEVRDRAARIKMLILDVDGVLTDGRLIMHDDGKESKEFHVHDGHGIRLIQRAGIEVGLLTGRSSEVVKHRAMDLGIQQVILGSRNKLEDYEGMLKQRQLDDGDVAYVGDDLVDIPVLRRVGLAVGVGNAVTSVHSYCHATTHLHGGCGAVREVCEFILQAQGKWNAVTAPYFGETWETKWSNS